MCGRTTVREAKIVEGKHQLRLLTSPSSFSFKEKCWGYNKAILGDFGKRKTTIWHVKTEGIKETIGIKEHPSRTWTSKGRNMQTKGVPASEIKGLNANKTSRKFCWKRRALVKKDNAPCFKQFRKKFLSFTKRTLVMTNAGRRVAPVVILTNAHKNAVAIIDRIF